MGNAVPEEQDVPGSQEYEENLSTPENLSQWFELHADMVEDVIQLVEEEHAYVIFLYNNAFQLFS